MQQFMGETRVSESLRFSHDQMPGIRRTGTKRFRYRQHDDKPVGKADLDRIRRLAIPPAWTDVWISADPRGHLQATGRDAKGRKQARYHDEFRRERDNLKFSHLAEFAMALPRLRQRIEDDLRDRNATQERQTALVVNLLDRTAMRVGNDEYRRANGSYGLSTFRSRHAKVRAGDVVFSFDGKSGQRHRVEIHDRRLARLVGQCQDLPGQTLFSYLEADDQPHAVTSEKVNDYIRAATSGDFTAKTFRTWIATTDAAQELAVSASEPSKAGLLNAIDHAASLLGNTRAVCRASYVHPKIQSAYLDGELDAMWAAGPKRPTAFLMLGERRTLHVLTSLRVARVEQG